jgi:uncharacterized protein
MTVIQDRLPDEFWQGVQEFNHGQFYACHDTLEALWIEAQEPEKTFYQGILQIAVACYHLGNRNWRGSVILLGEGTRRLSSYGLAYGGIDVGLFLDSSYAFLKTLHELGEGGAIDPWVSWMQAVQTTPSLPPPRPFPHLQVMRS